MNRPFIHTLILLALAHPAPASESRPGAGAATGPMSLLGKPAPDFSLTGPGGKPLTARSLAGKPAALLFFCGCEPCHDLANLLAGSLTSSTAPARYLVLFLGSDKDRTAFMAETGLDRRAQVESAADSRYQAALKYQALPCPRVFVTDSQRRVTYVNAGKDDSPQKAPAASILAKLTRALEQAGRKPPVSSK